MRDFWIERAGVVKITVAVAALISIQAASANAQNAREAERDPRRANASTIVANPDKSPTSDDVKKDGERMDPSYQAEGVQLGSFLLLPKAEVDQVFNDNIYARGQDEKDDFITVYRPELALNSQFATHALNFLLSAEDHHYAAHNSEDHFDYKAYANGRLDVSSNTEIYGYGQYLNRSESRSSPDDAGGVSPTEVHTADAQLGAKHRIGSYVFSAEGLVSHMDFENVRTSNGTLISNADRERTEYTAKVRGLYEMFPSYGAVLEVGANQRDYAQEADSDGYKRSSTGQNILTGVAVDVSSLVRGDVLVGYMRQDYDDPRLQTVQGPMVRAVLNWTPTPQALIVSSLESSVSETTSTNVSGIRRLSGNLLGRYELRRNVLLSGFFGVTQEDYEGSSQEAMITDMWARASYAFNSNVYVSAQAEHTIRSVENGTGEYDQTTMLLRLGLQM